MAFSSFIATISLLAAFSALLPSAFASVICEELPPDLCAFSISSNGLRCVLESESDTEGGAIKYQCDTSDVVVPNMADWIETDECLHVCGLDRYTVGISSDALLEWSFKEKLCSDSCNHACPNIFNLYSDLATEEGVSLLKLNKATKGSRGVMMQLDSEGIPISMLRHQHTTS